MWERETKDNYTEFLGGDSELHRESTELLFCKEQDGRNYDVGMKRNLFYFEMVFILFGDGGFGTGDWEKGKGIREQQTAEEK